MSWSLTNDTITKTEISKLASFIKTAEKLTYGDKTLEFENKFSKWNNSKYSVMVNSGSSANLIMAIALKKHLKKRKNKNWNFISYLVYLSYTFLFLGMKFTFMTPNQAI